MSKIIIAEEVPYEKVEWGLTKELITPHTVSSKNIKVKITEYLPGYIHELHVHPGQEEVIYVLSGKGISETKNEKQIIEQGSIIFIPAGEPHATLNLSNSESLKVLVVKSPPDDEELKL